jgi:NADP-dependent 3-hydroxy acid dehydrogenase YdfG
MVNKAPHVWLITGCSSEFGDAIAREALSRGEHVIATTRSVDRMVNLKRLGAVVTALDVCNSDEIVGQAIEQAVSVYGRIDVLVNNAGCILEGTVEECR